MHLPATTSSHLIPLGRTGLLVSRIALGTVALGLDYGIARPGQERRPDRATAERLLMGALEAGVNFLDTARAYGESEALLGAILGARRNQFLLATKVVPDPADPSHARRSVEESLRALATDVLDLVYLHCPPRDSAPDEGTIDTLDALRREGKIRFLGASVYGEEAALAAVAHSSIDCLQIAVSALDRRLEERLYPAAASAGTGLVARSVLLKGALTDRAVFLPDALGPLREQAGQLAELADEAGMTMPELAYRYVLSDERLPCALSGATSLDELLPALDWAAAPPLPPALIAAIRVLPGLDDLYLNPGRWPAD